MATEKQIAFIETLFTEREHEFTSEGLVIKGYHPAYDYKLMCTRIFKVTKENWRNVTTKTASTIISRLLKTREAGPMVRNADGEHLVFNAPAGAKAGDVLEISGVKCQLVRTVEHCNGWLYHDLKYTDLRDPQSDDFVTEFENECWTEWEEGAKARYERWYSQVEARGKDVLGVRYYECEMD